MLSVATGFPAVVGRAPSGGSLEGARTRVTEALDDFLYDLEAQGRGLTAQSYRSALKPLRALDAHVAEVTPADLRRLMAQRQSEVARSTLLTFYASLRSFFRWCVEQGILATSPASYVKGPKAEPPAHRYLTAAQLRALYAASRDDGDRLILLLCGGSGLRSAEFLGLRWRDIDLEHGVMRVFGKGRKWRELAVEAPTARILARWREQGRRHGLSGAGADSVAPVASRSALLRRVWELCDRAGIPRCTVHMLRHSFAVAFLLESGEDAFTLQTLLGHASPVMTGYYVRAVRQSAAVRKQRAVGLTGRLFDD